MRYRSRQNQKSVEDLVDDKKEDYMKMRPRQKGNLDSRGKKFMGVAGKSVEYIESSIDDSDDPVVFIQFTDETALEITVGSNPNVTAELIRTKNGEDWSPVRRKAFL